MTETREEIKAQFDKDIKTHVMTIIRDDGLYRHIQFRRPGSSTYHYEILTWPGFLCICGDMGTSVFRRTEDMFTLFRSERINPGYWGEKLQSIGTFTGYKKFSAEVFKEQIKSHFEDWEIEPENIKAEVWADIEDKVLNAHDGEPYLAYEAVQEYKSEYGYRFVDFFDGGACDEFTYHYIWILYAIVEGIRQYDEVGDYPRL